MALDSSLVRDLKRKCPEEDEENDASASGVGSSVHNKCQKHGGFEGGSIRKDIVNIVAKETLNDIMEEFKDDFFGLLVHEYGDISHKEQMGVGFRYFDKMGIVKEQFVGSVHVKDTSSSLLKAGIDSLFSEYGLSLSRVRALGYNGASNMQGMFDGLKTLIVSENKCAYFVHCFSHQLQLILVALARDHNHVGNLFDEVAKLLNVAGASCEHHDLLHEQKVKRIKEALRDEETESGQRLNQELAPIRTTSNTRWGYHVCHHYKSLMNVVNLFDCIMDVLEFIEDEGKRSTIRNDARASIIYLSSFDFAFTLQLILTLLGITHDLSQALLMKDKNIANAMDLVKTTKEILKMLRKDGWDSLMDKTNDFCEKHGIPIPNMDDKWALPGRSRRDAKECTYEFHYRVELFYAVVDLHLDELKCRFNETNTELLICVASLSPWDRFSAFDQFKLVKLARFYPDDFSDCEIMILEHQLLNFVLDVHDHDAFQDLEGLGDLYRAMVETKKDITYPLVFRLLKLALILPVSTATVK